jgi:transcriptional regulator
MATFAGIYPSPCYISLKHMSSTSEDAVLKKGTAELLVLAQLEGPPRHGYEIAQQIAARAQGGVSFQPASLYPVLYRLERRGLITGRWVEKAGQRRRRYYRLTAEGRKVLAERRKSWRAFMSAVQQAAGLGYA